MPGRQVARRRRPVDGRHEQVADCGRPSTPSSGGTSGRRRGAPSPCSPPASSAAPRCTPPRRRRCRCTRGRRPTRTRSTCRRATTSRRTRRSQARQLAGPAPPNAVTTPRSARSRAPTPAACRPATSAAASPRMRPIDILAGHRHDADRVRARVAVEADIGLHERDARPVGRQLRVGHALQLEHLLDGERRRPLRPQRRARQPARARRSAGRTADDDGESCRMSLPAGPDQAGFETRSRGTVGRRPQVLNPSPVGRPENSTGFA